MATRLHCLQWGWGAVNLNWVDSQAVKRSTCRGSPQSYRHTHSQRKQSLGAQRWVVAEAVKQLLGSGAPELDEICPGYLKALDVVGLSWLTRLCNIAFTSGAVPLEWQTGVVVPIFKKGDQRSEETGGLPMACPLRVGEEFLPQVEEFKYLGVLFMSQGKMEREMDRRIGADPGHAGRIISLDCLGNASGSPRRSWLKWLGRGLSGPLC
ncbi:hypothetical protein L3Q82_008770 [Scortum barcoo]|uniref:Uncharacterized protein n=1 Tax=Scortum barcoo TaxID=214431 RepID=A0ACB8XC94_9TELE|nr:hypothetical protein L3Q82_008770 [Scortum barcoo]